MREEILSPFPPSPEKTVFDAEIVKDLPNGLIDDVFDGLGLMIKGWHRREDVGAHVRRHGHESEMPLVKRGLPDQEGQFAFFFECDIGGPDQEVFCIGIGDP